MPVPANHVPPLIASTAPIINALNAFGATFSAHPIASLAPQTADFAPLELLASSAMMAFTFPLLLEPANLSLFKPLPLQVPLS